MTKLPEWLDALRSVEDSSGARISRIVNGMLGISLDKNPKKLAEIFLANEPDYQAALVASTLQTNCATSMRAIYALAGCDHSLVTCPVKIGMALSWVLSAAREKGALVPASSWRNTGPGWGLHYATKNKNDDHVEFLLDKPDSNGLAKRAGGGKARNAIAMTAPSDIRWSVGRPLVSMIDPDRMLAPSPPFDLHTTRGVQAALNSLGYGPLVVDGVNGPKTTAAVRAFQHAQGLSVDGVVGPKTRVEMELKLSTS